MVSMQNQGGQDPGGGYQPIEPGYSAPPQKKSGFNWLACCGISCGVILIITVIFTLIGINMGKKFMASIEPMINAAQDIKDTDITEIRSKAVSLTADQVGSDPGQYTEQWIALDGEVMNPGDFALTYYGGNEEVSQEITTSMRQQGTAYFLRGGIMMTDTSNQAAKAGEGETVRAYGKVFVFDLGAMPFFGALMKEELGDNSAFTFFIAKEVEALEAAADEAAETTPGGEETGGESTWD